MDRQEETTPGNATTAKEKKDEGACEHEEDASMTPNNDSAAPTQEVSAAAQGKWPLLLFLVELWRRVPARCVLHSSSYSDFFFRMGMIRCFFADSTPPTLAELVDVNVRQPGHFSRRSSNSNSTNGAYVGRSLIVACLSVDTGSPLKTITECAFHGKRMQRRLWTRIPAGVCVWQPFSLCIWLPVSVPVCVSSSTN